MSTVAANVSSKPGSAKVDRVHDLFGLEDRPLDPIFAPKNVAVIGATERPGSVGRSVLWNLLSTPFGGTVYPINPARHSVLGIRAYSNLSTVPEKPDLVVVVTPAATVPGVIREAVELGVRAGIIISAGFKEHGEKGRELERQIAEMTRGKMRVIGPNCLGVMNPLGGLNATFASAMARPGNVAFLSQSGALCTAVLDWSLREMVGFSALVSVGSMLDVGWGDLIDYFGHDPRTHSIVIYMESVGDARSFLSAAREVSLSKPIIVIKAGHTQAAAQAAASHTGSLTGSDEVLDAAFRRVGVLRVNSIGDFVYMSEVLARQPRPRGPKLTIVTNAGGPGVLATDTVIALGGRLAKLSPQTLSEFDSFLPPHWSHNNPIDILGDSDADRYAKAVALAAKDPETDGMLVILAPQGMTKAAQIAEQLRPYANSTGKPVLASWMGGADVAGGEEILNRAGIPTFPFPDMAAKAFCYMWRYSYNLRGLYETPSLHSTAARGHDSALADGIVRKALQAHQTTLTEYESKRLLAAYGLSVVPTEIADKQDEAVRIAGQIGYPVVLKLHSETITHKTDVGGVQLDLRSAGEVRTAFEKIRVSVEEKAGPGHFQGVTVQPMVKLEGYELIIGSSIDVQFGPVLLFGAGGQLAEIWRDRALALPPLNSTLARRMMEQTKIYTALKGVRGRLPVNLEALEDILVRFSELVADQPRIKEIDINPLFASHEQLVALDARVVLHGPEINDSHLPRPAVRPYPAQYVYEWTMKDGTPVTIRPIRPEDEPLVVKFHEQLSARSVYLRYFQPMKLSTRTSHERLTRICFIDYDREMALVGERMDPKTGEPQIMGISRLSRIHGTDSAESAIVVLDEVQHLGLGTELLRRSIDVARAEKLKRVVNCILPENTEMRTLSQRVGFSLTHDLEENVFRGVLLL